MATSPTQVTLRKIGRRIAELRHEAGLTQEDFAARLKLTVKYVQRVEAGRHNVSVDSLVKFSRALKSEPRSLFEEPQSLQVNKGRPRKTPG